MELTKFKICPECGKHNPPSLIECRYCEADLTGIRIVDSESASERTNRPQASVTPENASVEMELARICDCGEVNPPQARKCRACGEDISDIIPKQITKKAKQPFSYALKSVDGEISATIDKPLIVVGREAELNEYLSTKAYVSRQHGRISVVKDKVFVENLSRTNKTFVNNVEIPDGEPIAISDGDEIGLGGKTINGNRQENAAYFVLQIKP